MAEAAMKKRKIEDVETEMPMNDEYKLPELPVNGQVAFVEKNVPSIRSDPSQTGGDGKAVTMDLTQFLRLYGTIMSGVADRPDGEDGPTKYALGNGLYLQWSKFRGNNIATVRRFATLKNGNIVALKKDGPLFGKSTYDNLKKMFKEMKCLQDIVAVPQFKEGKPGPGMKFKELKNGLAHLMYQHILGLRRDRCPTCLNPETEPDCPGQGHSCEYGIPRMRIRRTLRRPRRRLKSNAT
ncbi:hypothetical protein BV898_06554 [Hypsibius exemplaris]|uniref:Uncharacterized protein n=1 Tax=Hypsibius exemplaris TaxID=2072580 RepID=A0A1W0WW73_HYPEX|nr:hypothetical protein BV898_06554 [Hypsibius exemplaris]